MVSRTLTFVTTVTATLAFTGTLLSSTTAHARGPYLPQNAELSIPGVLLVRGNLNERCEERLEATCDPHSEYVLLKSGSAYEFGRVTYDCKEIDDGAYGALSCQQKGYVKLESYSDCRQLPNPPFVPTELSFHEFYCTK